MASDNAPASTHPFDGVVLSDDALLGAWQSLRLPFDQWTHRAHVRVAFILLKSHPFPEALSRLRSGIQAYNAHNKVPESATSGYNETTTHAFAHLVAATIAAYSDTFPTPDSTAFCDAHPQLMTRYILRAFYSPARRMLPDAKTRFVEPDLAPLPRILSAGS